MKPSSERDPALAARLAHVAEVFEATQGVPVLGSPDDPLDELVLTILSQSTNDTNSGRAFDSLRRRFPTWDDVLAAETDAIKDAIRSGGLAKQKSVRIKRLLARVKEEHGKLTLADICSWSDERVYEWLGSFEGVGVKTIAVVLMFACRRDVCPVDTHVHRIAHRLGFVRTPAGAEETFWTLLPNTPPGKGASLHLNFLLFGRTRCSSRAPECDGCPFCAECLYNQETGEIDDRPPVHTKRCTPVESVERRAAGTVGAHGRITKTKEG